MRTSENWGVNRHRRDVLVPYSWPHSVSWCLTEISHSPMGHVAQDKTSVYFNVAAKKLD